jgi:hypothetical protein
MTSNPASRTGIVRLRARLALLPSTHPALLSRLAGLPERSVGAVLAGLAEAGARLESGLPTSAPSTPAPISVTQRQPISESAGVLRELGIEAYDLQDFYQWPPEGQSAAP